MDGNKDESDRCIEIASAALKAGNVDRAEKFARKAESLFPSSKVKEFLNSLAAARRSQASSAGARSASPSGVHQRRTAKDQQQPQHERDYTDAQLETVNRIKRCSDYYEVLGVSKTCTDSEIKKAYKKLALQLHPDKNRAPGSVEAFKSVGNAVAVLTDAQKRKEYDMFGSAAANNGASAGGRRAGGDGEFTFNRGFESEYTADELFNMFFGNGFHQQRMNQRNQRQYAQQHQDARQPSLALGLIIVLIVVSMLSSFLTSDPVYSLSASTRYPVQRHTSKLNIRYYVKEKFESEYQGTLSRLESSVEDDYISIMRESCYRERNYREMMMIRARSYGSSSSFKAAKDLKAPSCENLARIGLTKYMPY